MKRLVLMLGLVPLAAGCVWFVAGGAGAAGAYVWVKGSLARNYMQPMETAWEGTNHALRNLRLKTLESKHDAFDGYITAKMAKGEKIKITLERWTNTETRITVRVGAIGDRSVSMRMHEEIERALR